MIGERGKCMAIQYEAVPKSNTKSFELVSTADFLVFDQERGLNLLRPNPSYEFMHKLNDGEC